MSLSPDQALQFIKPLLPGDFWTRVEIAQRRSVTTHGRPDGQWCYFNALQDPAVEQLGMQALRANSQGDIPKVLAISAVPTLALWRLTRGAFQFDPTLLYELLDADVTRVPAGLLERLPEYCVYIPLGGLRVFGAAAEGVFVHVAEFHESAYQQAKRLLRIVTWTGSELQINDLPLISDDLQVCFDQALRDAERDWQVMNASGRYRRDTSPEGLAASVRDYSRVLSLTLYLCSTEPDIGGERLSPLPPAGHKGRFKYRAPGQARVLPVGFRFGAAIRAWQEQQEQTPGPEGQGGSKMPHVRRGHWHLYRVGKGRQETVLKWLHPVLVNVAPATELPVTVRPVERPAR